MEKNNMCICNWCMKTIRKDSCFYTFKRDKDFHDKCFKEMSKAVNIQLKLEKEGGKRV